MADKKEIMEGDLKTGESEVIMLHTKVTELHNCIEALSREK